jgi:branched-chain amino acid transport system ATP-binding protein
MPLLEVDNIHVAYGALEVVKGLSLVVQAGEIVTVLGSNGAGKTTTLRTLAGLLHPTQGRIRFDGHNIETAEPHLIAKLGIALVPEGRQLFPEHTVRENLELGAYLRLRDGKRKEFSESVDAVFELFPHVRERLDRPAGLLSGGEQQMVAIGRALVRRPRLMLLDEPSLGLAPIVLRAIFDAFVKLKERGVTILIVEQMAWLALEICDRAYVLESGRIALAGNRDEIATNPRVIDAYLGVKS